MTPYVLDADNAYDGTNLEATNAELLHSYPELGWCSTRGTH